MLARLERETGDQVVVVTVGSLQGYPIEDFGYQLGRHWGIGQQGKNTGAILIVAPNERKVRIEVGYGLEGQLTDAASRIIIEREILPLPQRRFQRRRRRGKRIDSYTAVWRRVSQWATCPARSKVRRFAIGYNDSHSDRSAYHVFEKPPTISGFWIHAQPQRYRLSAVEWFSGSGGRRRGGFGGGGGSFGGGGASGSW